MTSFKIPTHWLSRRVDIGLIGAGGNGSRVLTGLAELDRAMRTLGHPGGLNVQVWDADQVSQSNVGRQAFYASDVGHPKPVVLVHRLNVAYGLDWQAVPRYLDGHERLYVDLLIGAVDSRKARRAIHQALPGGRLWLDMGNEASQGQVILGQQPQAYGADESAPRLPTVVDLFPEILDEALPEDDAPSCSMEEALEKQELFINRMVSDAALNLLWRLVRYGEITYHGQFINARTGHATPLMIDPVGWSRFGYHTKAGERRKVSA